MKVTLISPNITTQKGDFFGSGIPYMPVPLAYVAAYIREKSYKVQVIDGFGENPFQVEDEKDFLIQGLKAAEIVEKIDADTKVVVVYAGQVVTHLATIHIIEAVKKRFSEMPVIVMENMTSVVAYSLGVVYKEFFRVDADYVLLGDCERKMDKLLNAISTKDRTTKLSKLEVIDGLIYRGRNEKIIVQRNTKMDEDLDTLPFPAWDLFPIRNYWKLHYAHGPMKKSFLPIFLSRGCPYKCEYCITPSISLAKWRPRSAKNIVDEIEEHIKVYGVREFHTEDLNPTINRMRIIEMCKEIVRRGLDVDLKIVSGTKAESLDEESLDWMKKAGFSYISISPESGSERMLKIMNKPFNHNYGERIVKYMHKIGITTQACFVLGFPGETKKDMALTKKYVYTLTKAGVDEVALFIMTPIPGSKAYEYSPLGYGKLSQLTFSPKWRKEYNKLNRWRAICYLQFFFWKMLWHPVKLLKQPFSLVTGNFKTKMEMTIYRLFKINIWGKFFGIK
jgi:anaerobic magnesium-protoporphyrin IX monomethyl ester cyclase